MSSDISTTTTAQTQLTQSDVQTIAKLGALTIDDQKASDYANSLNNILNLMQMLSDVDTDNIEPMHSPFNVAQPTRPDMVSETDHRDDFQTTAPAVESGCYLVPRVIE